MRCSSANSPVGSHQCADSLEKCAISSGEMVLVLELEGGRDAAVLRARRGAAATTRRAARSAVRDES